MLVDAAARGLAPPKLRPFFPAAPCFRPLFSTLTERRAENEKKSLTTTACKAVPGDDNRLGAPHDLRCRAQKKPTLLSEGLPTQEAACDALAELAVDLLNNRRGNERVVVGLAGGPGSGKSTTAAAVVKRVNEIWRRRRRHSQAPNTEDDEETDIAVVLPMDGFHLTRTQLSASVDPTPEEMFARRGAHWTFDGEAFVETVREVIAAGRDDGRKNSDETVLAPSFDHGVGDPCPGAIEIRPSHLFVLVEGNYLLLPREPWSRLVGGRDGNDDDGGGEEDEDKKPPSSPSPPLFDQTWFLDVGLAEAMERVRQRQLAVGVLEEASRRRIEENDGPNGELVASTKGRADVVVRGDLPL